MKHFYVYIITNKILNKQYVGSRICYKNINEDVYWGSSKYLKEDYKIYGKENFIKEIISSEYINVIDMLSGESECILKFNTLSPNGYNKFLPNMRYGFHWDGCKHTKETNEKNRLAHLGKIPWNKGLTKETDIRIKPCGETLKNVISNNIKLKWQEEEYRDKIIKANTGKKRTQEQCINISKSLIGRNFPDSTKIKMSESAKQLKECPCCHKVCNIGNYNRWHGNNCKIYKNINVI